jgi:hypothetical protein
MKSPYKAYYIGEEFYGASGTMMSSLYTESGFRSDWLAVRMALEEGREVHIRQATDAEMLKAYQKLHEHLSKKST